jgi:hypothetical protein
MSFNINLVLRFRDLLSIAKISTRSNLFIFRRIVSGVQNLLLLPQKSGDVGLRYNMRVTSLLQRPAH